MARNLHVTHLDRRRLGQVFPLLRMTLPQVALQEWLDYARKVVGKSPSRLRGVAALEDSEGYIYGMFCYAIEPNPEHGRTLRADYLLATDIVAERETADLLVHALDDLATEHRCGAIHATLLDGESGEREAAHGLLAGLRSHGYRTEGVVMCRRMPSPRAALGGPVAVEAPET